jgi:transposase-like protein
MRYSASEKFEIIELVEQSSLSIRRTLAPIGIPRSTFYDWYSRYQEAGSKLWRMASRDRSGSRAKVIRAANIKPQ